MENLLNPHTYCTDPDTLQFCLPISDTEFWYCQVNDFSEKLFGEADTMERFIYDTLCGNPKALHDLAAKVSEVKAFVTDRRLWCTTDIDVTDFSHEEQQELLSDYGLKWDSFNSDRDRNQIICECYFEENIWDFDNE